MDFIYTYIYIYIYIYTDTNDFHCVYKLYQFWIIFDDSDDIITWMTVKNMVKLILSINQRVYYKQNNETQ